MPITTITEVKKLLQIPISDTSKDDAINSLILKVQTFFINRINNCVVPNFYYESYNISFVASDKSINDDNEGFLDAGFVVGNEILVQGTFQNDKVFTISTITASKIVVTETVVDEDSDLRTIIHRIVFGGEIEMAAIDFIAGKLNKERTVKNRSLGDHSETFITNTELMEAFSSFRKLQYD